MTAPIISLLLLCRYAIIPESILCTLGKGGLLLSRPKTQRAIMNSFVKLLNLYPLDKITVKDIVSDCGISRNTFYYHYQDIYDLLGATFSSVTETVLSENVTTWRESLMACTRFALENRRAVYHIYHSANRDQLERCLNQVAGESMEKLIRYLTQGLSVSDEDIGYLTLFYKHAIVGILLEWLENDMKADVEHVISRMAVLLEGNLRLSLERIAVQ